MPFTFARVIPSTILRRVADRPAFLNDIARCNALPEDALFHETARYLHNLERLEDRAVPGPDGALRLLLVPEIWERLRPGTRDGLRRISSTLAEYKPDPKRPTIFTRLLSPESRARLCEGAEALRGRIAHTARLETPFLIEQVRFAIAGSRASASWSPGAFVYEPAFTYRLVPSLAWRLLVRCRSEVPVAGEPSACLSVR